uniref:Uncharacterized protein n=1 Tax=Leersia perrieri TaxID=77586 RepID=A0A0D9WPD2_9ORYZ
MARPSAPLRWTTLVDPAPLSWIWGVWLYAMVGGCRAEAILTWAATGLTDLENIEDRVREPERTW